MTIWLKEHEECDEMFTPQDHVTMGSILGKVSISICTRCGYEDVNCMHIYNRIDSQNVEIECLLCGG